MRWTEETEKSQRGMAGAGLYRSKDTYRAVDGIDACGEREESEKTVSGGTDASRRKDPRHPLVVRPEKSGG